MYKNYEIYEALEKGRIPVFSEMGIILNPDIENISYDEIINKIKESNDFKNVKVEYGKDEIFGTVEFRKKEYKINVRIIENDNNEDELKNIDILAIVNNIDEREKEIWKKSKYTIVLGLDFKMDLPSDYCYFVQLSMLEIINPNYVVMFDMSAQRVISAKWVKMLISDNLLPLNDYLFSMHTSYDAENNDLWLHTHGLTRCGSIELELLGLTKESTENSNILTTIAKNFIENGTTPRNEPIRAGYSSNEYLEYVWKPWEESMSIYAKKSLFRKSKKFLGCLEDRDEYHRFPSGVLFAYKDGKIEKPVVNSLLLKGEPVFFFSKRETEKISKTAKIRLPHFLKIFKEQGEKFKYLIKIGIKHNNKNFENDSEHLWFAVKNIDEKEGEAGFLTGILLNAPYNVEMKQGETYTVSLENVSDWNIYNQENICFNSDNIYRYYQINNEQNF